MARVLSTNFAGFGYTVTAFATPDTAFVLGAVYMVRTTEPRGMVRMSEIRNLPHVPDSRNLLRPSEDRAMHHVLDNAPMEVAP